MAEVTVARTAVGSPLAEVKDALDKSRIRTSWFDVKVDSPSIIGG